MRLAIVIDAPLVEFHLERAILHAARCEPTQLFVVAAPDTTHDARAVLEELRPAHRSLVVVESRDEALRRLAAEAVIVCGVRDALEPATVSAAVKALAHGPAPMFVGLTRTSLGDVPARSSTIARFGTTAAGLAACECTSDFVAFSGTVPRVRVTSTVLATRIEVPLEDLRARSDAALALLHLATETNGAHVVRAHLATAASVSAVTALRQLNGRQAVAAASALRSVWGRAAERSLLMRPFDRTAFRLQTLAAIVSNVLRRSIQRRVPAGARTLLARVRCGS